MPEYVYALHDFLPEHQDEVAFRAGERIEVVEKDDLYGDGWWQGRNLSGKIGLFPQSYTAPAPPSAEAIALAASSSPNASDGDVSDTGLQSKTLLQPLPEESESGTPDFASPTPAPAIHINGHDTNEDTNEQDGANRDEVMKATMTDVQKAIEQLGRGRGPNEDGDGARSFSFASSREDRDTEGETDDTDIEMSDVDRGDGGQGWHKGARRKLAEKARRAVEEAEKLEMMMGGLGMGNRTSIGSGNGRLVAPPIEVEVSDESEGEEDHEEDFTGHSGGYPRDHPFIPEEDEDVDTVADADGHTKQETSEDTAVTHEVSTSATARSSGDHSHDLDMPEKDESEKQTATATRTSFPSFQSPPQPAFPGERDPQSSLPTPVSPVGAVHSDKVAFPEKRISTPLRESLVPLPSSPTPQAQFPTSLSEHSSVASSTRAPLSSAPPSSYQPPLTASSLQPTLVEEKKEKVHPSEWSVEDVTEWLKGKGFDQDVRDKFVEQEITGDVLLELDVNVLKTELGIMAFGKRMRIANAITDLRRPPSIIYSDHPEPSPSSPMNAHSPPFAQSQSHSHSRNQSVSQSHHSYPGQSGHVYSQSMQSSVNSPLVNGNGNAQFAAVLSPESATHTGDWPGTPMSRVGEGTGSERSVGEEVVGAGMLGAGMVGLGIGLPLNGKGSGLPGLMLSPSDSALTVSPTLVSDILEGAEERGVTSESEAGPANSMRRRLFGRSHDSSTSSKEKDKPDSAKSQHSKEGKEGGPSRSSNTSPTTKEIPGKVKDKDTATVGSRHARAKKSTDGGKSTDRLSIFGGTFSGTLGKSRKPAPRYSVTPDDLPSEKGSAFSLPRLYGGGSRKSSSGRPSTPGPSPKTSPTEARENARDSDVTMTDTKGKEKEPGRDPALLRKRTSSSSGNDVTKGAVAVVSPLKLGQSILEQIGDPDHTGWMRKKGDRYNSWKLRYFVLSGPHLYCLKSNSTSEKRIKGYINIIGYKVTVDENVNPGRYGFRIDHEQDKSHFFSSEEKTIIRDWMKAIMKATIGRDYSKPVVSSCNISTIPLMVAQAMNPGPRPPSPTARDATQKALRRENPNQLSQRDARVLMGLPSNTDTKEERARLESFFSNEAVDPGTTVETPKTPKTPKTPVPPRPAREMRRLSPSPSIITPVDDSLIEWANAHLPSALQITDTGSLCGGLALLRLAESIKGRPSSPPIPDSAFPKDATDDKLDGLFKLFDFLLDNDVKMGSVSINDIRQGKREKVVQLLRALKSWEDKRRALAQSIGKSSAQSAGFIPPVSMGDVFLTGRLLG